MTLRSNAIETEAGVLSGLRSADGFVTAFKGAPYAKPPVGPLRWRAPEPMDRWTGVRAAETFGPRSIQPDRNEFSISYFGPEKQSEDCLYLNIWTGAKEDDERRPVMVWFHGGAFRVGSGALPIFDGANLARAGVVVVTVNYRLGPLGFMSHPALSRETPNGTSGNYGLLDQIAALTWVRNNIAGFGGDPDRVTIFGQSVGSSSVACLMASPLAQGLFHRAIGQSGGSFAPPGRPGGGSLMSWSEGERCGLAFAKAIGANTAEEMRARSADDIQLGVPDNRLTRAWPLFGDHVIPEPVHDCFLSGKQIRVPLMTGSNGDEGSIRPAPTTLPEFYKKAADEFGDPADDVVDAYMSDPGISVADASRRLGGHKSFNWQNWTWARLHSRSECAPTFYYHFSHLSPIDTQRRWAENSAEKLRAFHTAEISFVYRNLQARDWMWRDVDRKLSDVMSAYWINFAATGDPNGDGLPRWKAFDHLHHQAMRFDGEAASGPVPDLAKLDCFDAFYARQSSIHGWVLERKA